MFSDILTSEKWQFMKVDAPSVVTLLGMFRVPVNSVPLNAFEPIETKFCGNSNVPTSLFPKNMKAQSPIEINVVGSTKGFSTQPRSRNAHSPI